MTNEFVALDIHCVKIVGGLKLSHRNEVDDTTYTQREREQDNSTVDAFDAHVIHSVYSVVHSILA